MYCSFQMRYFNFISARNLQIYNFIWKSRSSGGYCLPSREVIYMLFKSLCTQAAANFPHMKDQPWSNSDIHWMAMILSSSFYFFFKLYSYFWNPTRWDNIDAKAKSWIMLLYNRSQYSGLSITGQGSHLPTQLREQKLGVWQPRVYSFE